MGVEKILVYGEKVRGYFIGVSEKGVCGMVGGVGVMVY